MFAPKNMHKNIQLIPLFRWKQSGNNYQGYKQIKSNIINQNNSTHLWKWINQCCLKQMDEYQEQHWAGKANDSTSMKIPRLPNLDTLSSN